MLFFSHLIEHGRYLNILGVCLILAVAYLFSSNRSKVNFARIGKALSLQFLLGLLLMKTTVGYVVLEKVADFVNKLYLFADKGSEFVFGSLADPSLPWGFVFAIKVLPIIIFFGALMSLLFYYGVVQWVVGLLSHVVRPFLGITGPEAVCAISNSFLGQTEAPLLVKDYLKAMNKSELLVVMVSGMGTVSGAILAVFAAMGVPAKHLLAASVMAIPGSIMMAKILYPGEKSKLEVDGTAVSFKSSASNAIDAISSGTSSGLGLALNVGAMLVSFLALLALVDYGFGGVSFVINWILSLLHINAAMPTLTLNLIFGWLFAPFAYLLGFSGDELLKAGQLLGTKLSVNELVAYGQMVKMGLSARTEAILTYALCGFSNFSCIGIQIGGIGALVPEKRKWLTELGFYALLGGSLSNLMSAMLVSLVI